MKGCWNDAFSFLKCKYSIVSRDYAQQLSIDILTRRTVVTKENKISGRSYSELENLTCSQLFPFAKMNNTMKEMSLVIPIRRITIG